MSLRFLVLLLGLLAGFSELRSQEKAPASDVKAEKASGIYFQYAVYYAPKPSGDPLKKANAIFQAAFAKDFTYRSAVVRFTKGSFVEFRSVEPKDYAPPNATYLEQKGFGITETERERLQKTSTVLVIDFFIVQPESYEYVMAANNLAGAVAEATGGFIWDEETRELFSVAAWRTKRQPTENPIFANTSMHGYQIESGNFRSVTFGMRKFGLPDFVLTEFPKVFWEPFNELMQFLVIQSAVPGPLKPKLSWSGEELQVALRMKEKSPVSKLELVPIRREEGDPRNELYTVNFLDYPGKTYHEKQAFIVDTLMRPEDGLLEVWREREQLMALRDQALERLKAKKPLVEKGLPKNDQLLVKAFVETEYLWLRLQSWKGDQLKGVRVADVTAEGKVGPDGDAHEVALDQVFDYLHIKADGSEDGNETTKFIQKLRKKAAESSEDADSKNSGNTY